MHQPLPSHQLTRGASVVSIFSEGSYDVSEVDCLLPARAAAGQAPKTSRHAHSRSFSNTLQSFSVYQPRKVNVNVELPAQQETVDEGGADEPLFPDVREPKEWLHRASIMLPKISWGWLPFGFTFLGFSVATKLLLFITSFSVYCSALMYRLYEHTDALKVSLADVGQEAMGRFGRRLVRGLTLAINVLLPVIMHVGGCRYLQFCLFVGTGVCLPWISLIFGLGVLAMAQVQRLGAAPRLHSVVIPTLTQCAVVLTIAKLLLLKAAHAANPPPSDEDATPGYISDYVMALLCLISANFLGQHLFLSDMSAMEHPASFQHSTATAQVLTLLTNAAIGVASFHVPTLKVKGFIAFAFEPSELLPRFINAFMCAVMALKYVAILHDQTKSLMPWLPHLMQQVVDPTGVESGTKVHPRQLWLLASGLVLAYSYIISNTFQHTFMGLSGLLTSIAFVPLAYTLPCLFSLTLMAHKTSALEYALQTWVIPVSIIVSLVGIWASVYHLLTRWVASGESKGCWGCNAI